MARLPDLSDLTYKQLVELRAKIDDAISERQQEERDALKAKMRQLAEESGHTLEDLFGTTKARNKRSATTPAAVKYRNPDNPNETWSGRGRPARWITEKLKRKGAKLEDFLV